MLIHLRIINIILYFFFQIKKKNVFVLYLKSQFLIFLFASHSGLLQSLQTNDKNSSIEHVSLTQVYEYFQQWNIIQDKYLFFLLTNSLYLFFYLKKLKKLVIIGQ